MKIKPINQNVVVELEKVEGSILLPVCYSKLRSAPSEYNIGLGKVVSSEGSKFKEGDKVFFGRSLSKILFEDLVTIKEYRILGYYERY